MQNRRTERVPNKTLSNRKFLSICLLAIFWTADTSLLPSLQEITTGVWTLSSSSLSGLKKTEDKLIHQLFYFLIFFKKKREKKNWPATHYDLHIDTLFFILFSAGVGMGIPRSQISCCLISRPRSLRWRWWWRLRNYTPSSSLLWWRIHLPLQSLIPLPLIHFNFTLSAAADQLPLSILLFQQQKNQHLAITRNSIYLTIFR